MNDGEALATLASGEALVARLTDVQHVEVSVAERNGGLVARELADLVTALLDCAVTDPVPGRAGVAPR